MSTLTIELPPEIAPQEATMLLALKLLEMRRVSLGRAVELAGVSKREFLEIVSKHGLPIFDYAVGDLENEANM